MVYLFILHPVLMDWNGEKCITYLKYVYASVMYILILSRYVMNVMQFDWSTSSGATIHFTLIHNYIIKFFYFCLFSAGGSISP